MKDIFYSKKKSYWHWVSFFFAALISCLHIRYGFFKWVGSCASILIYPLLFFYHYVETVITKVSTQLQTTEFLQHELDVVKKERDDVYAKFIELKAAIPYAQQVDLLHIVANLYTSAKLVTVAQVIMRHFAENEHYFLINAGSSQRVEVDMIVVYNKALVGRVVAVYPWYSKVALITDKSVKIPVFVGDKAIPAIYEGCNNQEPSISYVNQFDTVQEGDLVISSGQGLIFPYGFAIGVLSKKSMRSVGVTFFIDFKEIRYCTVIAKLLAE